MSETPEPRYCAPGDGVEGGYTDKQKDLMSEEPKKKKGRGPGSTAAGDLLIYKDADGIEWPGRHVRFNKGKTMKLPNKKQVACTITVQLDGYTKPSIVPYLDVTYLPKGDAAVKIATEPIEQPQPPIWRSVTDVIDETDVVWDNELQKSYVMVDEDGVVFTYEVEPGIETLADLERLMQLNGWQLGEDAVQPPITTVFRAEVLHDPSQPSDQVHDGRFPYALKTAAEAKVGDWIWYMIKGKRHYSLIDEVLPEGILFANCVGQGRNAEFGTTWGFTEPYGRSGESSAAEATVDAIQGDNAAEEPKTVPVPSHMLALRWDSEILGDEKLPYRIWGIQFLGGSRYRVVETPGGNIDFAPGPTSVLKAVMPKAQALSDWQVNTFRDTKELAAYMALKTGYGSVVHGAFADALNGVTAAFEDRQWWLDYLKAACARNGAKGMEAVWLMDVQKSLMSIRQWAIDYKVRFLFVEKALYAPKLGVCGQIDMLVEMDSHIQNVKSTVKAKREEPTRILALVDIKTGKDSDQYPAQLAMYKQMLIEGFPRIKEIIKERYPAQVVDDGFTTYNIPCLLLFPESGWRKAPKAAKMLDRTEKAAEYAASKMHHHIELFKSERRQPPAKTVLSGPSGFDFTNDGAVGFKTLADVWMDKIAQGDLEPVEDINEEDEAD